MIGSFIADPLKYNTVERRRTRDKLTSSQKKQINSNMRKELQSCSKLVWKLNLLICQQTVRRHLKLGTGFPTVKWERSRTSQRVTGKTRSILHDYKWAWSWSGLCHLFGGIKIQPRWSGWLEVIFEGQKRQGEVLNKPSFWWRFRWKVTKRWKLNYFHE